MTANYYLLTSREIEELLGDPYAREHPSRAEREKRAKLARTHHHQNPETVEA